MATWHQQRNVAGMQALYAQHETKWKCVCDSPGGFASAIIFGNEAQARAYCAKTGAILIPPKGGTVRAPSGATLRVPRRAD